MGIYGKSKPNPITISRMMVDEHPLRPNNKTAAENRRARKLNKAKPKGDSVKPQPSGSRVGSPWSWENLGKWSADAAKVVRVIDRVDGDVHRSAIAPEYLTEKNG